MTKTFREILQSHIPNEKGYVSNSSLTTVKKLLTGQSLFFGDEKFLHFGSEIHRRILEPETPQVHFYEGEEEEHLTNMKQAALGDHLLRLDYKRTKKELIKFGYINGMKFKAIYDMLSEPLLIGADLKSTSTTTFEAFVKSCIKYDYFRQAWIYINLLGLKEFRFYALQKRPPYSVFVLNPMDYPDELDKAESETLMLIEVVKLNTEFHEQVKS